MSHEINKIIVAVLLTVLLVFGIGKISDIIFHIEKPNVQGYKVEVKVGSATTMQASTSNEVDISTLLALGNVDSGKKLFNKCKSCHSIKKDGGNKIGPNIFGILNRNTGSISDYKYSKALASYGKKWTFEELNGFLLKPSKWIKGNKMGFSGIRDDIDRASVILYLNENSDNPIPLP